MTLLNTSSDVLRPFCERVAEKYQRVVSRIKVTSMALEKENESREGEEGRNFRSSQRSLKSKRGKGREEEE